MKNKLDRIGIFSSILCAIHCAILPLFIIFIPSFFVSLFVNDYFEWCFLIISFIIGIISLCFGYKKHKSFKIFPFLSAGLILVLISKILVHNYKHNAPLYLNILMILGGLLIAFSHYLNDKLCNSCIRCKNEN